VCSSGCGRARHSCKFPEIRRGDGSAGSDGISTTLFAADGQPLAPLGASPLQYQAAVLAAHTNQRTVRTLAVTSIGLKRALSLHCCPPKSKRTVNRSEAVLRVSNRMALCYSRRPSRGRAEPFRAHARSVSHQSFPHLWKKLWKIARKRQSPDNSGGNVLRV